MDALRGKKKTEQNLSRNSTWASSNYMREREAFRSLSKDGEKQNCLIYPKRQH